MSKLNQKELLSILEIAFSDLLKDINYKETKAKYEQAHQQIKEMIQKPGTELPGITEEWAHKKANEIFALIKQAQDEDLNDDVMALHYFGLCIDIITSILDELALKVNEVGKQKPEVTEEWIEEKAIELNNEILLANYKESYYNMSKDFIRSLVEEIK